MSTTASGPTVGSILSATFSTFGQRFVHFVPLALLCYVPVFVMLVLFPEGSFGGAESIVETIVDTMCASIFASIATYEVVMNATGRHVTLGQTISAILPRLGLVLIASLLYSLIVGVGTMFFIVPGLYFMTVLFVLIPAIVVEGLGIGAGFSRTSELTRGYRWPIFGVVLILMLTIIGISIGSVVAIEAVWPGASETSGVLVGLTAIGVVIGVLSAIATAHTFVQLRIAKEGSSVQELAEVFS